MNRRILLLLPMLLLVVGCGSNDPAEPTTRDAIIEIPLDGLTGDYAYAGLEEGIPNQRSQTVRFPADGGEFVGMRVVVDGGWDLQGSWETIRVVNGITFRDTIPFPARFDVTLTHPEVGETDFRAIFQPVTDPMEDWWREFTVCCPSRNFEADDMAQLAGRDVTVEIAVPGVPDGNTVVMDPQGTLDQVKLVIEAPVSSDTAAIFVLPNPATREALEEFAQTYPDNTNPGGFRIVFSNLPAAVGRISIFDGGGELVRELNFDSRDGNLFASWNLFSNYGRLVPTGTYHWAVTVNGDDKVAGRGSVFISADRP